MKLLYNNRKIPYAYETLVVGNIPVSLTPSSYIIDIGYEIYEAIITVEDNAVFIKFDGSDPSGGHKVSIGGVIVLESYLEIKNFKAVTDGSINATLKVSY